MRSPHVLALGSLLLASAAGFSNEPDIWPSPETTLSSGGGLPDPVVNEQKTHASVYADVPVPAEVVTELRTAAVLPDLDVRSLAILGTDVYAGTASGLAKLSAGQNAFTAVTVTGSGAVLDLAVLGGNQLVLARAGGVEVLTALGGAGAVWPAAGQGVTSVTTVGAEVYIGDDQGLSRIDAVMETPIVAEQGFAIRDLAATGDVVWMATSAGVRRYDTLGGQALATIAGAALLPDDDVRALAVAGDGKVLAATATGLARIEADGSASTIVLPGPSGLPNGDLRAVAEAGGEVLTGHGIGATAMTATHKDHYHTLRWIPDEAVTAVAIANDHTRWIATNKGVSRIAYQDRTLADKAALFAAETDTYFRMDGFVCDGISYADPWDHSAGPSRSDFDNDGLWTEMQIAAWCFAYAETGDEAHYQHARKAMSTMFLLVDVPAETFKAKGGKPGFVARSLVREDEGALYDSKANDPQWHQQSFEGKTYYWKGDTSSDEYAGHFFGIPVFYDLCAKDEAEKKAIRDRVDQIMSYVVDGGELLLDLDGEPTTFGRWKDLAVAVDGDLGACVASGAKGCVESFGGGGWLNSIEILGHLLAAWHITGDRKYYDEYERLAIEERYGDMVPLTDHTFTVTARKTANHSDYELASLAYFTLLRYEPNEDRRKKWQKSLLDFFAFEVLERNTLEHAVIASAVDEDPDAKGAIQTLSEWLVDLREWLYDNGHRLDVMLDPVNDRFDDPQFVTVLPYDEIRTMKWNNNPYVVSSGGDGKTVQGPWPYLLPYWMMRHFGAIKAP